MGILATFIFASVFILFLIVEKLRHNRRVRSIPLRICVTGTRGKSSVTRMIASILRESGRRVVAKTTGSAARLILPDGTETDFPRRGPANILEQKKLVKKASSLGADCLVAEMMSIHPENHRVEARHLLQPSIIAVTNVRRDHTEAMGETEEEIASAFLPAIPPTATAFIPQAAAKLFPLKLATEVPQGAWAPHLTKREYSDDLDLVHAVGRHLGVDDQTILAGIRKVRHDPGHLDIRVWHCEGHCYYLVNAFAANDPESTWRALEKARALLPEISGTAGILNLRADRPARTLQWIAALRSGGDARLDSLYVLGGHSGVVQRKLRAVRTLGGNSPEAIMKDVARGLQDRSMIFGFGNMGGAGKLLVSYWERIGEPYAV